MSRDVVSGKVEGPIVGRSWCSGCKPLTESANVAPAERRPGFPRSTQRYRSVRNGRVELRITLGDLAASCLRYGCPRLHTLFKQEGWWVNHKLA